MGPVEQYGSPTGVVLGNAGIASSSRRRDLWPRLQPVLDICEERRVQSHDEFSSSSELSGLLGRRSKVFW
jgi:hypothetical protein